VDEAQKSKLAEATMPGEFARRKETPKGDE
jgi:hypothetical protein